MPSILWTYERLLECIKRDNATVDISVYTSSYHFSERCVINGICHCGNQFSKYFSSCYSDGGLFCKACVLAKSVVKRSNTYFERTGYKYNMQNPESRKKYKQTLKDTTGYEIPMQNPETREKQKQTLKERTGYEYTMQNPESQEKQLKTSYYRKKFQMPSGDIRMVQGYEPQALTLLLQTYQEEDILTGSTNVPEIWYTTDKEHRHYVDIYIKSINTCIEVKSTWTYQKDKENIHLKQQEGKNLGMKYEIWIMDKKGSILQKFV